MRGIKAGFFIMLTLIFSLSTNVFAAENEQPKIYGKAGITIDIKTGEIIYENNIDTRCYPASTTKLLTALLLAENKSKNDMLVYTESAKEQPANSINLNLKTMNIGEKMTAQDVMDCLLLFSANDAACIIADNISGNGRDFEKLMNERIRELGLKNTNFITPNGLHDNNHYTTPYDLSVIARAAFKNDWVREVLAKKESKINTSTGKEFIIENTNKLLGKDYCIGGKTGYTDEAGRCLVAFFDKGGRQLIGIVMNSTYDSKDSDVFEDMQKIIDWSYNAKPIIYYSKNTIVETESITYKPLYFFGPEKTVQVPLVIKEDAKYYDNEVNKKEIDKGKVIKLNNINVWKLDTNSSAAVLTLKEREAVKNYKLYSTISTKDIIKENMTLYVGVVIAAIVILIVIICCIFLIKGLFRKKRIE